MNIPQLHLYRSSKGNLIYVNCNLIYASAAKQQRTQRAEEEDLECELVFV